MAGVSVSINGKDMFSEYGVVMTDYDIGNPTVQKHMVSVPLRDGDLDYTDYLTNSVKYGNRPITMLFLYQGYDDFTAKFSEITNLFHGKECNIIFDRDLNYYYVGRLEVGKYKNLRYGGTFQIEADCQPFKLSVQSTADDWLWDPFNFETGYINDLKNIQITNSAEIVIYGDEQLAYPKVTSNAQFTVTFGTKSVTISSGTTTLYDFELQPGVNTLTFTGTGTITIDYRGARL